MNTGIGLILFFVAGFALVITTLVTPAIEFYAGAFVIFLFMAGIFYAALNTIRQTNNLIRKSSQQATTATEGIKKDQEEEKSKASEEGGQLTAQSPPPPTHA